MASGLSSKPKEAAFSDTTCNSFTPHLHVLHVHRVKPLPKDGEVSAKVERRDKAQHQKATTFVRSPACHLSSSVSVAWLEAGRRCSGSGSPVTLARHAPSHIYVRITKVDASRDPKLSSSLKPRSCGHSELYPELLAALPQRCGRSRAEGGATRPPKALCKHKRPDALLAVMIVESPIQRAPLMLHSSTS